MSILSGFWSYVHDDDRSEDGRICRLAEDVVSQYELLTGEKIELFLDRDDIKWGEDWRRRVDSGLASTAFFVPVLTPRYFMSSECRRELHFYARAATSLGFKELVLPLLYVDVALLKDPDTADELVGLVNTFQWEDWREIRFANPASEDYRRGVARLAGRLVEANAAADQASATAITLEPEPSSGGGEAELPGVLDRLADGEQALPEWTATVESMTADIELIGELMQAATGEIEEGDSHGKGFALRLTVAHRLSKQLAEPAERIWASANQFVSQLRRVDDLVRTIIELAPGQITDDTESRATICGFFHSLRELSASAHEGLTNTQGMISSIGPLEAMSRDLRAPLRRLRQGLTIMVEAREISDDWIRLIEQTDLECDDTTPPGR